MNRLIPLVLSLLAGCASTPPAADPFPAGDWVDLTHDFAEDTIVWPTSVKFSFTVLFKGESKNGYHYEANKFAAAEHGGTHVDAPCHFFKDRHTVDRIPVERLIGRAAVIDVSTASSQDPDYQVRVQDLQAWEAKHGPLPPGAIVLLRTGRGKHWPDPARYMGTAERGSAAVKKLHFPGLHPDAARWLGKERRIGAIGLDTPSIDFGQSRSFEAHQVLFEQNIPAFENVANLERLPASGAWIIALPMKIRGGSGAPLRIVAWLPKS